LDFPCASISIEALKHNFIQIKTFAPNSKLMSVIKADAYGHGVLTVAEALKQSDAFAVARLHEALYLRENGIQHPIVILEGVNTVAEFELAAENDLSPVIHAMSQVVLLETIHLTKPLTFNWIMVDSGMHRLGIRPEQITDAVSRLKYSSNLTSDIGLMSHFANSDLINDPRNHQQLDAMVSLKEITQLPLCLANSAAVMSYKESHQEWVRPGLMLYGLSPFAHKQGQDLGLKPVMQLRSRLIAVYDLRPGEEVGYGGDWTAETACNIGVVSVGYGDGYQRSLSNQASVLINGKTAAVIGRVSMDTICVDLTDIECPKVGDSVILWGHDSLTVETLAKIANTIPYELVTVLNQRVKRDIIDG